MSRLLKTTTWSACCEGCFAEYGGKFAKKEWAEKFLEANPLCPDCDGELY